MGGWEEERGGGVRKEGKGGGRMGGEPCSYGWHWVSYKHMTSCAWVL